MTRLSQHVSDWLGRAREKLARGELTPADLDALGGLLDQTMPRQRLLYIHARGPSIYAPVIGMAAHEPLAEQEEATLRTRGEMPYKTVHEAVVDGWQIIHFPEQSLSFEPHELEYIGYQFILQKIDEFVLD